MQRQTSTFEQERDERARQYLAQAKEQGIDMFSLFRLLIAENFGVPVNPAVRQFNQFVKKHPIASRFMFGWLGVKPCKSLTECNREETEKIALFVWVAKKIYRCFTTPTSKHDFLNASLATERAMQLGQQNENNNKE